MAKTKNQIVSDINSIFVTNGDITAIETNGILKDILDCEELNAQGDFTTILNRLTTIEGVDTIQNIRLNNLEAAPSGLRSFAYLFRKQSTNGVAELVISVRGIRGLFANIMLHIRFLPDAQGTELVQSLNYVFEYPNDELFIFFNEIINPNINGELDFLVKIKSAQQPTPTGKRFKMANMNFNVNNTFIAIGIEPHEYEDFIIANDVIYTTITLHTPLEIPDIFFPTFNATGKLNSDGTITPPKGGVKTVTDPIPPPKDIVTKPTVVSTKPTTNTKTPKRPIKKPIIKKPTSTKPIADKPTATKPIIKKPVATKPVIKKPTSTKPTVNKNNKTKK